MRHDLPSASDDSCKKLRHPSLVSVDTRPRGASRGRGHAARNTLLHDSWLGHLDCKLGMGRNLNLHYGSVSRHGSRSDPTMGRRQSPRDARKVAVLRTMPGTIALIVAVALCLASSLRDRVVDLGGRLRLAWRGSNFGRRRALFRQLDDDARRFGTLSRAAMATDGRA